MTLSDLRGKRLRGTFYHAPTAERAEVLADAVIAIDGDGIITEVIAGDDRRHAAAARDAISTAGLCFLPGFVDLHIHAPQYPQLGQALDEPLEVWLGKYTFPLEFKYRDLEFARPRYDTLVRDLIADGTTTALYFATVHLEATKLLAEIALTHGQRALIGKVVMDDPASCPSYYRDESAARAIAETRAFIDFVRQHPDNTAGRVLPVITPRFIPSCTDGALAGLGALALETGAHVQTHCSESDWAHDHALTRYGITDAAALDRFGLLTRRTVLAHAGFITDDDMQRIAQRGAAVAHCPVSNAYFANAVFPLRRALEKGVRVGLGTDISGGPISSMFDATRATVMASRMLQSGVDPETPPSQRGVAKSAVPMSTAFHIATAGGAAALDLPVGRFEPGRKFDAIAIDCHASDGGIRLFGEADPLAILEKILYTATRQNIARVFIDGQPVGNAA